ncbi:hypothetical protein PE066_08940 [Ramlibacter tataouinensis]|uniref:hypothetical protein n=1 Tax=Ramlibacter tataouinensis TaxID=94132 RepID=UPI0022F3D45A|nr:hypothetical protein [Ramlibacter tataouinensis]WBY03641.1 hypothetical protein PE066_08940 [Ramlibacter tataouinensis]
MAINSTVTAAVVSQPFVFDAGVPALGTIGATTLVFTDAAATPAFAISADGSTASGTTTFGSCIFTVRASTFPPGHPLALGQTVTVNPCNIRVNTAGAVANGVATSRSVALLLGAAASAGASVTIGVTAGGSLSLNGHIVTTITLTPVTSAG